MKKEILINATSDETRIAITEDGRIAELFLETPETERNVGDIYLGKTGKVIPGIRAAFIDLGFPQDAFLHFSDISDSLDEYSSIIGDDSDFDDEDDDEEEEQKPADNKSNGNRANGNRSNDHRNGNRHSQKEINLERGQDIVVQITKEPVGKKGFRVTSKVSIPGRYLVLMPFGSRIGISKKIFNSKEKRRLRSLVRSALPKGFGIIIRTVAQGNEDKLILDDLNNLINTWNEISAKLKTEKPPTLLYKDASTLNSVIRDLFREDVNKVIVDSKKLHREIVTYLEETSPEFLPRVQLYSGNQPLFDSYNVEKQIQETMRRKVWLKNGGYIIIEATEAMTVVDVNSGKYAKSKDQEVNSLATNIEAANEIVRQVRLRDIGGIIVIDFIDLYDDRNKKKLYEEVRKEFRKDRAKVTVLPLSDFGLCQITRQRIRQTIIHSVSDTCMMCKGSGRISSRAGFLTRLERILQRYKGGDNGFFITLKVNPYLKTYLESGWFSKVRRMSLKYFIKIKLEADESLAFDDIKIISKKHNNKDVTEEYDQ
ncbi:MAG: Rne/Rng family ribonuclease [Bacteroidetes bacterium]|nr:Rne/Rng family ribonuclease [Bacteroidota bacterium]